MPRLFDKEYEWVQEEDGLRLTPAWTIAHCDKVVSFDDIRATVSKMQEMEDDARIGSLMIAELKKRTCTSCWFDSHTGCVGPRSCVCWKCYPEDGNEV